MTVRFLDAGECALSVEFGQVIDDALAARVLALDAALAARPVAGVLETVPTYRALMVHYDPLLLARDNLVQAVRELLAGEGAQVPEGRLWQVPACHDFAEDLGHVAAATGLSGHEVLALYGGAEFRVVMYGFAPGWAYLSGLPAALTLPRRTTPRDRVPAGSLMIAGGLAIIAAQPMPSGWHILGRTPVRLFDMARDPPFLLSPGDRIRFRAVDRAAFDAIEADRWVAGGVA